MTAREQLDKWSDELAKSHAIHCRGFELAARLLDAIEDALKDYNEGAMWSVKVVLQHALEGKDEKI